MHPSQFNHKLSLAKNEQDEVFNEEEFVKRISSMRMQAKKE